MPKNRAHRLARCRIAQRSNCSLVGIFAGTSLVPLELGPGLPRRPHSDRPSGPAATYRFPHLVCTCVLEIPEFAVRSVAELTWSLLPEQSLLALLVDCPAVFFFRTSSRGISVARLRAGGLLWLIAST